MTTRRVAAIVAVTAMFGSACALAPIDLQEAQPLPLRTTIKAADGTSLARLYRQNRALLSIDDIPQVMIDAVVAAEDSRFFDHSGFDVRSIARAAVVNWREGEARQGGSTITQQYVKNTYFRRPEKTVERKLRELRIAIEVEHRFSKEEILERYLNTVYLGNGAYGFKAAVETYFRHRLRDMTLAEAALLAALIKAPSNYDPRAKPRRARQRRNYVITRMQELGKINALQAGRARRAGLGVIGQTPQPETRYPYFVEAVKREILSDGRLGNIESERARALWRGGLQIETTLDPSMQRAAEDSVAAVLNQRGDPEAALVAIRPSTGEIVAMVGGRNWKTSQVNLALGRDGGGSGRQPGSSFKPIVAAAALESGTQLDTRFESSPAAFSLSDGSTWPVANAEGRGYGLLPLDEALVKSVNGVYARLALQLGAGTLVNQARLMGVKAKLPAYPSISLGSAEVSVLDMAAAYATLANKGTAVEPTTIKSIRLSNGEQLGAEQEVIEEAVSPGSAYLVTKVLQDVIRRGTGTRAAIGRPAAGKTGTTNDHADAWFVGYTPDLVAAVWVGYPSGRVPMSSVHGSTVFGGTLPADIWRTFMMQALEGSPPLSFERPEGDVITLEIDPETGLLAAPWCPGERRSMLRQLAPTQYCPQPPPEPVVTTTPTPSPTGTNNGGKDNAEESPSPSPSPSPTKTKDGKNPSPSPSKS